MIYRIGGVFYLPWSGGRKMPASLPCFVAMMQSTEGLLVYLL
ncbi:hypothetical protein [Paenibacillus sp. NEAU-GSW1]|nr:hypothetical protein [Paenibacillus sp. NEAU-GSW1]